MAKMKAAMAAVLVMEKEGVSQVFGVPGAAINPLYAQMAERGTISHVRLGAEVGGQFQIESYLDHQAHKLVGRFDANSYIVITEALMSHDASRGRGSLEQALKVASGVEFMVAAVNSDRLYFPTQSEELAAALPGNVVVASIDSPIGHDGFLTEVAAVGDLLAASLFRAQ